MVIKVIFLDFDGVIRPVSGSNPIFNSRNIDNLNELVKKTNAKIVVSSDWRLNGGLEYVKKILYDVGVNGDIIDITPFYKIENDDRIKVPRGLEIKEWINKFNFFDEEKDELQYVSNYVILDDHMDMLIEQLDHIVEINQSKGFDGKALKESIEILTKNNIVE